MAGEDPMKRIIASFVFSFCVAFIGCDAAESIVDGQGGAGGSDVDAGNGGNGGSSGCTSDNQCRGERICVRGECTNPPHEDAAEPDDAEADAATTDDAEPDEGTGEVDAADSHPDRESDLCDNGKDDDNDGEIDCDDSDCTEVAACRDPNECSPACSSGFECRNGRCYQQDPCDNVSCHEGYECQDGDCVLIDPCANVQCNDGFYCEVFQGRAQCNQNEVPCTPSCNGRTCGSNGCGGSCGSCGGNQVCNNNGTCVADQGPSPEGTADCNDGVDNDRDGFVDCADAGCANAERCQNNDRDGDGRPDGSDNCFSVANPNQADSDGDGRGDVCDNCPQIRNDAQVDTDRDGLGDACDNNGQQCGGANNPACPNGQHCQNNVCTQDCNGVDNVCPAGQVCVDRRCVDQQANACGNGQACAAGEQCVSNRCIRNNCSADLNCTRQYCSMTGAWYTYTGNQVNLQYGEVVAGVASTGNRTVNNNDQYGDRRLEGVYVHPNTNDWGTWNDTQKLAWCTEHIQCIDRCGVSYETHLTASNQQWSDCECSMDQL